MNKQRSPNFWETPGWKDQARAWIDAQMHYLGLSRSGELDQLHQRPFSTVFTVPTGGGILYFKAASPALAHEAALTQTLAGWFPRYVPAPLACDPERGWMLLPDIGPPNGQRLREVVRAAGEPRHWYAVLQQYANLQMQVSSHQGELEAIGVPQRGLKSLPGLYEDLLKIEDFILRDQSDGLASTQIEQLHQHTAGLAARCRDLSASPIPESLNHGDFHDGNIFIQGERYWFMDWGDATITHPFFSLRTVFVSLENSLGWPEGSPKTNLLRDAYLEPWSALAPRAELGEIFALSQRLAPLVSALSWLRVISTTPSDLRGDSIYAVPGLLQEFLELNP